MEFQTIIFRFLLSLASGERIGPNALLRVGAALRTALAVEFPRTAVTVDCAWSEEPLECSAWHAALTRDDGLSVLVGTDGSSIRTTQFVALAEGVPMTDVERYELGARLALVEGQAWQELTTK